MQRMHYVMHYVMHRVLAKIGWPSLDRVLSKMGQASLRSYKMGSYKSEPTVFHGKMGHAGTNVVYGENQSWPTPRAEHYGTLNYGEL